MHVADIMRKGEQLPRSRAGRPLLPTALEEMSRKGIGMTCVVDANDALLGIFTDGDLRRTLEKRDSIRGLQAWATSMTRNPAHDRARTSSPPRPRRSSRTRAWAGAWSWSTPPIALVGALTFHDLLAARVV